MLKGTLKAININVFRGVHGTTVGPCQRVGRAAWIALAVTLRREMGCSAHVALVFGPRWLSRPRDAGRRKWGASTHVALAFGSRRQTCPRDAERRKWGASTQVALVFGPRRQTRPRDAERRKWGASTHVALAFGPRRQTCPQDAERQKRGASGRGRPDVSPNRVAAGRLRRAGRQPP